MLVDPERAKSAWESAKNIDKAKADATVKTTGSIYAAMKSGNPDIAKSKIIEAANAKRNSGDEQGAQALEHMAGMVDSTPDAVTDYFGLGLSALPGGDTVITSANSVSKEHRDAQEFKPILAKKESDAKEAAVKAKYADANARQEIEKRGWDMEKIRADISDAKERTRIAAMEATLRREENKIKRDELTAKIEEAKAKHDDKIAEKAANLEAGESAIDSFLNNADDILKTPDDVMRATFGPIDSRMPTLQPSVADLKSKIDSLSAQAFLAQVEKMKGLGALTEKEGQALTASLGNFDTKQSADNFRKNVKEAQRLMTKARENLAKKYNLPSSPQDRPNAPRDAFSPSPVTGAPAAGGMPAYMNYAGGN